MYLDEQPALGELPPRWQQRFDFFAAYGSPTGSAEARATFKAFSFGQRHRIGSNVLAYLFGPFYFFSKGMWRKGLSLLGVSVCVGTAAVLLHLPDALATATACGLGAVAMTTANYAYFLHVTAASQSWNPYEGMGRQR